MLAIVRLVGGRAVALNAALFLGESISYDYPASIKRAQDALKTRKEIMQRDGRAKKVSKGCLMFEDLNPLKKQVATFIDPRR